MSFNTARVVICGSFKRDVSGLLQSYRELIETNCQVLSPHTLNFDDAEFVRDPAQKDLSSIEIERFHLMSICQADFIWLHAPDGYMGASGAFELGYAVALGTPIYSRVEPSDQLLKQFTTTVISVFDAKQQFYKG